MVSGPPVLAALRKTLMPPSDYLEPLADDRISVPGLPEALRSYGEVI